MNGSNDMASRIAEARWTDAAGAAMPDTGRAAPVRHRLLMCPPTHFAVEYVINPWMAGQVHRVATERAAVQWQALREGVEAAGGAVEQVMPGAGLPDMPFAANAGLVLGRDFVPSRFRHPERSGEEPLFIDWFHRAGFRIRPLPAHIAFEGAGDALLDRGAARLWMGHGHRSDLAAAPELEHMLDIEVVPLRLVDPRFYHLDTCLCPLRGGRLLYYPAAFDAASRQAIEARVPPHLRIAVKPADALDFACNAVDLDEVLLLHRASPALQRALAGFGYRVLQTALDEFLRAGGSAKCLTLRLDEMS